MPLFNYCTLVTTSAGALQFLRSIGRFEFLLSRIKYHKLVLLLSIGSNVYMIEFNNEWPGNGRIKQKKKYAIARQTGTRVQFAFTRRIKCTVCNIQLFSRLSLVKRVRFLCRTYHTRYALLTDDAVSGYRSLIGEFPRGAHLAK